MPKMSALELRDLLTAHRWDSMSAITASKLSEERATSLDYYQGDMSKYMPAPAGRPSGCARSRAGDRLRQPCLYAGQPGLPDPVRLHQGFASQQERHRQSLLGESRAKGARDLSRPAARGPGRSALYAGC